MNHRTILSLLGACAAFVIANPAAATHFVVDTNVDLPDLTNDGVCDSGSGCTLRAAVMEAASGTHTIDLAAPGPYILSFTTGPPDPAPVSGDLDITGDVTITGFPVATIEDGGGLGDRLFHVRPGGALSLVDVNLFAGGTSAPVVEGGAVLVDGGSFQATRCIFGGNIADRFGGAIFGVGGATIAVTQSAFSGNQQSGATGHGGAIAVQGPGAALSVTWSLFNNNLGNDGGAVAVTGGAVLPTFDYVSLSQNEAQRYGGAMHIQAAPSASLSNAVFEGNRQVGPTGAGGAVALHNNTPIIASGLTFEDNEARAGGALFSQSTAAHDITDVTFLNNVATAGDGGGAYFMSTGSVLLTYAEFENNNGRFGGGLALADSEAEVRDSIFAMNTAELHGGAIYAGSTGWGSADVAGLPQEFTGKMVKMVDSWVHDNEAFRGAIGSDGAFLILMGVGIDNNTALDEAGGIYAADAKLQVTNNTISNNVAPRGAGAGVFFGTVAEFNYSTIVENSSEGILVSSIFQPSVAKLKGTILATNGPDCHAAGSSFIQSEGHNLLGAVGGLCTIFPHPTDKVGTPGTPELPLLLPLHFNGGLSKTHMLADLSPALDGAEVGICVGVSVPDIGQDQRSELRPVKLTGLLDRCDIGAVERQADDVIGK